MYIHLQLQAALKTVEHLQTVFHQLVWEMQVRKRDCRETVKLMQKAISNTEWTLGSYVVLDVRMFLHG